MLEMGGYSAGGRKSIGHCKADLLEMGGYSAGGRKSIGHCKADLLEKVK
jgi:hypothetical protein